MAFEDSDKNKENLKNNENINESNDKDDVEIKNAEVGGGDAAAAGTNWAKELRDWVIAIVVAVVIALVVRNYVFTLVKVQGQSMEPSLHNNDRLSVNRLFYKPEKGDIIIFRPATDPHRPYVKRVIATEGDTVYIDFNNGDVYVNNELLEEDYIKEKTQLMGSYIKSLISKGEYSKNSPIVIQPGYVFAMGDNRNNSKDSRELGPIPTDEIMGGAVFRFWPISDAGKIHQDAKELTFMIDGDGDRSLK